MEKPFACSICHKAFAKLNSLGDHVENVHILKKTSEKSHEIHSGPKNSIVAPSSSKFNPKDDQSEFDCEKIQNNTDPKNIENSIVDQSEPNCEKIKTKSDPKNIENSILDQSEPGYEKIQNHSDLINIENSIVDQSESDCVEIKNQVEILIKDYPNDLKDHLREAFAKLNSPGDHVETVNVLKKSENGQKNHSDPKNIENSIVDQSADHVESVNILQTLSKNTHENHSDPKSNQNSLESDCEKIQIQNLVDKKSKNSQGNHSDSKNTKGQLISE